MVMADVGERVTLPDSMARPAWRQGHQGPRLGAWLAWPLRSGFSIRPGPDATLSRIKPGLRAHCLAGCLPARSRDGTGCAVGRQTYGPTPVSGGVSGGSACGAADGWVIGETTGAPVAGSGTGWATPRSSRTHLTGRR